MASSTARHDALKDRFHAAQSSRINHFFSQLKLAIKSQFRSLTKKSSVGESQLECPSYLFDIACSLARIDKKGPCSSNSYPLRRLEWPVVRFAKQYELLVPPPCVEHASEAIPTTIADFLDKIPEHLHAVHKKANPEKLVDLMLPQDIIPTEARRMAAVFWLWLCITDDILEAMSDAEFKIGIADMQATLSGQYSPPCYHSDISSVTRLLNSFIQGLNLESKFNWRNDFLTCLLEIADAFRRERPLVQAGRKVGLRDWMLLRVLTISARPFMVLARASLGLPTAMSVKGNPHHPEYEPFNNSEIAELDDGFARLEATMQCIMGLQNDILGFEKDSYSNHFLNAVQILILQGTGEEDALTEGIRVHNCLSSSAVAQGYKLMHTLEGSLRSSTTSRSNSTSSLALSLGSSTNSRHSSSVRSPTSNNYNDAVQIEDSYSGKIVSQSQSQAVSRTSSRKPSIYLKPKAYLEESNHLDISRQHLTTHVFDSAFEGRLWAIYITVLLGFGNAMATWHVNSKRYVVKA